MDITSAQQQEQIKREADCVAELDAVIKATLDKHNCILNVVTVIKNDETPKQIMQVTAKSLVEAP